MFRHTILTLTAALVMTLSADARTFTQRVSPPPAGTSRDEVPAFFSRSGVNDLRMTSSAGFNDDGHRMSTTVWRWTDDRGTAYKLTRRKVFEPGVFGNLGDYTLEKTVAFRPTPTPTPTPGGKLRVPPAWMPTHRIPSFYSPDGVNRLRVASAVSTDRFGNDVTETTWRWSDDNGVRYTLVRVKSGFSTSFRLSKNG